MFFPEQQVRVFLYGAPVDMRRSFDGLYAIARHSMPVDALICDGCQYVTARLLGLQQIATP
jgi:hypothetical protein